MLASHGQPWRLRSYIQIDGTCAKKKPRSYRSPVLNVAAANHAVFHPSNLLRSNLNHYYPYHRSRFVCLSFPQNPRYLRFSVRWVYSDNTVCRTSTQLQRRKKPWSSVSAVLPVSRTTRKSPRSKFTSARDFYYEASYRFQPSPGDRLTSPAMGSPFRIPKLGSSVTMLQWRSRTNVEKLDSSNFPGSSDF